MNRNRYPEIERQMEINNEKLKDVAEVLGLNFKEQVCRRLHGQVDWTIKEAKILCSHYNTSFEKLFKEEVKNENTNANQVGKHHVNANSRSDR